MNKKLIAGIAAGSAVVLVAGAVGASTIKGRLADRVEAELARAFDATVTYDGVNVSLLGRFPSVEVRVSGLRVMGNAPFEGIALAAVEQVSVAVDLRSVFRDTIEIEGLTLTSPRVHVVIDPDGRANYDIFRDDGASSAYHLRLADLAVNDLSLVYEDRGGALRLDLAGLDLRSRGDVTQDLASLSTHAEVAALTVAYGGLTMLDATRWVADAAVDYDMNTGGITLGDARFTVNELPVGVDGRFTPVADGWDVDLAYEALDTSFKALLSVIPSAHTASFASVEASGGLSLKGAAKGLYASERDHLPAFDLALAVTDGRFRYPDLPGAVEQIAADVVVTHPEGETDLAVIDVRKLGMSVAGSPLHVQARLAHPMTDPDVTSRVKGRVDLGALAKAWPLDAATISGAVDADFEIAGRLSDFEAKRVEKVRAQGTLALADVRYSSADLPDEVALHASAALSPQRIVVDGLRARFGKSDVAGSGQVDNVLPWLLSDATLTGRFELHGDRLDLTPFQGGEDDEATALVAVPTNIDATVGVRFAELLAEGLVFNDLDGTIIVRDGAVRMDDVKLRLLGGRATMSGAYVAPTADRADLDLTLDLFGLELARTFETFTTLERIAPVMKGASGRFDSGLTMKLALGPDGTPDLTALFSKGRIVTRGVGVAPASFAAVADKLMDPKLAKLRLDGTSLLYELAEGTLQLDPFDVVLGDVPARLSGTAGVVDRTMDLAMDVRLPAKALAGASFLQGVTADAVDVRVKLTGPWDAPKVTAGLASSPVDALVGKVREQVDAAVGALVAAAREQGDALIAKARVQADRVRAEAKKAGDALRTEARRSGAKLVAEARNPVAAQAAKQAAARLENEADQKATRLEREADRKATALVTAAEQKRDQLVAEAQ